MSRQVPVVAASLKRRVRRRRRNAALAGAPGCGESKQTAARTPPAAPFTPRPRPPHRPRSPPASQPPRASRLGAARSGPLPSPRRPQPRRPPPPFPQSRLPMLGARPHRPGASATRHSGARLPAEGARAMCRGSWALWQGRLPQTASGGTGTNARPRRAAVAGSRGKTVHWRWDGVARTRAAAERERAPASRFFISADARRRRRVAAAQAGTGVAPRWLVAVARLSAIPGSGGSPQQKHTPASCRAGTWPQRGRVPLTAAARGASRSARRRHAALAGGRGATERRRPRRRGAQAGARASVTPRWHVATTRQCAAHVGRGGALQKRSAASCPRTRWPLGGRVPSTASARRRRRSARRRGSATARGRDAAECRRPPRRGAPAGGGWPHLRRVQSKEVVGGHVTSAPWQRAERMQQGLAARRRKGKSGQR